MKAILYMATTLNGIIATHDDSADFITPAEAASYVSAVKNAGAVVVGRRTYEILSTQPEFQEFLKAGVRIVVVSLGNVELKDKNHTIAHSPKEALDLVSNFAEVIIAGGGKLNSAFLDANLIDEIYLDMEPAIVSSGIPLFSSSVADRELQFLGSKQFGEHEIQLHYKVVK
ncbi:dihydrofolate reductase family protein [Candidatus Gracilibacteria bacterium]|nr:dihydrofolate reductase family protein [Candidatus Gracilibacteria bacterium]